MINTKQFTIFFLLVVIFLVAIMIVTSLAWREAGKTYDTTSIKNSLLQLVQISADKIAQQEAAMQNWINEVNQELLDVQNQIGFFQGQVNSQIFNPLPE